MKFIFDPLSSHPMAEWVKFQLNLGRLNRSLLGNYRLQGLEIEFFGIGKELFGQIK